MPMPCATLLSAPTSFATACAQVSAYPQSATCGDYMQNSAQTLGGEIFVNPWKFLSGSFNFRKHVSTAALVAATAIVLPSQSIADAQRNIWLVQIPDDKISEITEGMPCDRAILVAQSTADRMQISSSVLMVQGSRVEFELVFSDAWCSQFGNCTNSLTIGDGHISRLETSNGRWTRIGTQEGCTSTETFTPNGIFMEGRTPMPKTVVIVGET